MEVNSSFENQIQNPTWFFDYDLVMDDISAAVSAHDFPPSATIDFSWNSHAINSCSTVWFVGLKFPSFFIFIFLTRLRKSCTLVYLLAEKCYMSQEVEEMQ